MGLFIGLLFLSIFQCTVSFQFWREALDLGMKSMHSTFEMVDWSFCNSTVHSNLGGLGPDSGDEGMRFSNISTTSSGSVDLLVTNTTVYSASSVDNNGLKGCFGVINILSPSTVTLTFQLVHSGTSDLIDPSHSYFSVYDIDESKKGMAEEITFETPVDGYWLENTTQVVTSGSVDDGLTFSSSAVGTGSDNPSDPTHLTQDQKDKAVTVEFNSLSEYSVTFKAVGEESKKVSGRNFMFAGKSDLPESDGSVYLECEGSTCEVWADPHISGFDNRAKGPMLLIAEHGPKHRNRKQPQPIDMNVYDIGDYWLVKNDVVHIQGRYQYSAEFGGSRSAVGAIAVGGPFLEGSKLVVEPKSGAVRWNSELINKHGVARFGAGASRVLIKTYYNATLEHGTAPSGVEVNLPRGVFLKIRRYNTHLDVKIAMSKLPGNIDGQCGNFNGNAVDDDLEDIDSRMHGLMVSPADLLFG